MFETVCICIHMLIDIKMHRRGCGNTFFCITIIPTFSLVIFNVTDLAWNKILTLVVVIEIKTTFE